jgi:hypothetical protein
MVQRVGELLDELAPEITERPASVAWRSMRERWGSCTSLDRTIRISDRLKGAPDYVLDSVLFHEAIHLRHFDHVLNAALLLGYVSLRQGDAGGYMTFAALREPDTGARARLVRWLAGLQAVGVLLSLGLLILPAATIYLLSDSFDSMLWGGAALGTLGSIIGLLVSFWANIPSGPAIVLVLGLVFVAAYLFGPRYGIIPRSLKRRHLHEESLERWQKK